MFCHQEKLCNLLAERQDRGSLQEAEQFFLSHVMSEFLAPA